MGWALLARTVQPARLARRPVYRALPPSNSSPSSSLYPHLPLAVMNWVGSLVAMLGTGLYSLAKQKASDDAKKAKAAGTAAA